MTPPVFTHAIHRAFLGAYIAYLCSASRIPKILRNHMERPIGAVFSNNQKDKLPVTQILPPSLPRYQRQPACLSTKLANCTYPLSR